MMPDATQYTLQSNLLELNRTPFPNRFVFAPDHRTHLREISFDPDGYVHSIRDMLIIYCNPTKKLQS